MQLEQAIGFSKKVNHFEADNNLPLPLELMGVELEYEDVIRRDNSAPPLWTAVEDGSLRNNGIEYIFSEPLYGTGIKEALDGMQEHVNNISPDVGARTSVHVHLNVSDMDVDQLMTLIILYLVFEKAIVSYHGGMREDNIFCVPYYKAPDALAQLIHLFQHQNEVSSMDVRSILSGFNKYYGLNIGAVIQHGSLEFRHMAGTTDMNKVREWICIIQQLKSTALRTGANYMDLITNMSGNSSFITSEVFGEFAGALDKYVHVDDLVQGARLAQRIVNGHHLSDATSTENRRRVNKKTSAKIEAVRKRVQKTGGKKKKVSKKVSPEDGMVYFDGGIDMPTAPPVATPGYITPRRPTTSVITDDITDTDLAEIEARFARYLQEHVNPTTGDES